MASSDAVRVRHILDAARQATAFIQGRSRADLELDPMLSLALVRLLEIIGEAARGASNVFRDAHPEIPWSKMAGMRDRLIHSYFDINLDVVWETVTQDLPFLITQIEKIADKS
ncbi:MAG: HepT-like ribonuclease domain-containing protein [Terriglobia bacterium]